MALPEMGDFLRKAKSLANVAGKKTGAAVEISKLKLRAVQINSMMQSTYERIGTLAYDQQKHGEDNSDLIAVCVREIDALLAELGELNSRIEELKTGVRCPGCSALNQADAAYCRGCGASLYKSRARAVKVIGFHTANKEKDD